MTISNFIPMMRISLDSPQEVTRNGLCPEENEPIFSSLSEENMYIWQRPNWPNFSWDDKQLLEPLVAASRKQGRLLGSMARLGFALKLDAQLEALTEEVIKSSEIEGEVLDRN